jgi:hypothetical protein
MLTALLAPAYGVENVWEFTASHHRLEQAEPSAHTEKGLGTCLPYCSQVNRHSCIRTLDLHC